VSAAATLEFAAPRERARAEPDFDGELYGAALALLAGGEVGFKLSTRVSAAALPAAKRRVYAALRLLPERWFVPPALARQQGFYDDWHEAVGECKSPDDQILAMPRNRCYGDGWDAAVECRPRDPADGRRFKTLQGAFGRVPPDPLKTMDDRLTRVETRLEVLEAKGTRCAARRPV
jgi:hypothetical protein